jgi:hypothetical protein
VAEQDSGVASSLLNTAQQVGGAIGLAVLGTVAWTTVADSTRTGASYHQALTAGFSRAFLVAAGIGLLAVVIALATIRVRREELTGAAPEPPEAVPQQAVPQQAVPHEAVPRQQPVPQQAVPQERAAIAAAARPCRLC